MSALSEALVSLLGDPETHAPLALATADELARLREAVRAGRASRHDGKPVASEFEAALLTQQRRVAYLVQNGIPNLLIDERLELAHPL
jgi:uncharacterized protein YbaR (Trm112 family)